MNTTQELKKLQIENALLTKLLMEKQSQAPCKNEITFVAFYLQWLAIKKGELQPSTHFEYTRIYTNYIVPYWQPKETKLGDITPEDIHRYYLFLKRTHGMGNNSLIRHHANMHTCFKYAYMEGYIESMTMDKVQRPKSGGRKPVNYYTIDELQELYRLAFNTNIYIAILLASVLGLSRSELLALKWDAVNFKAGTVAVMRKMTRDKDGKKDSLSSDMKTHARLRTLVLPDFLLRYLLEQRHLTKQLPSKDYAEFVCVDKTGKLPTLNTITNRFRDFILQHGLKKITLHQLRHSCASMLHALGYSLKDIQEWLGHSNIQTTANIYTHINLNDKVRVAKGIEGAIKYTDIIQQEE